MIADIETVLLPEVRKLSAKPKWPFEVEGQMELARIAREYGRDLTHVREVIRDISERWDHCPDGRELREALTGADAHTPAFEGRTTCPLDACDGSGWLKVFSLHTYEGGPNGTSYTKKQRITAEQYALLSREKLDPKKQMIFSGAKRCACQSVAGA